MGRLISAGVKRLDHAEGPERNSRCSTMSDSRRADAIHVPTRVCSSIRNAVDVADSIVRPDHSERRHAVGQRIAFRTLVW